MQGILILFISLCITYVLADRNFTIYHYTQGTSCQGEPILIQQWLKPGPNNADCSTNVSPGTATVNTPLSYQAYW
jgi:hypothetical protein